MYSGGEEMKIAIIGGGASGIACAVSIKQQNKNASVCVYEKLPRILKKILVTGNGRCNFTNIHSSPGFFRGDTGLIKTAFSIFPPKSNIEFFGNLGLLSVTEDEGRVYPLSCQATSVVNALLNEVQQLGIEIITDSEIKTVKKQGNVFLLNGSIKADRLVISCGGSAAKAQGTDGGSYRLLKQLGVKIKEPKPALTGVTLKNFPASLKGVRRISEIRLYIDGAEAYRETGEVQYNDYGVSGIPVMQLSSLVSTAESKDIKLLIDSAVNLDINYLKSFINNQKNNNPETTAEVMASGIVPKALGSYLLKLAGIKNASEIGSVSDKQLETFAKLLKELTFNVEGVRGFDFAQTTAGGVIADELCPDTLETKRIKGLFVTGEAVNVDGLCGGHNLQWAWSSGRLAAKAILKEI